MANASVNPPVPPRRRRWLRALAWIFVVLIVLLVAAYFVATSSAFLKGVILPKISAALNANVTVSDASISPFRQVILHNLKVQTTGSDPLITAPEVRLRYSLLDIIGGNIHVDEMTLTSPTIVLVENPDKTSNLDPILKSQKEKPQQPKPSKPSKPANLDIGKVALTDGTVRQVKLYTGGNRDVTELAHLNVTLDNLKNGQTGKLTLGADINLDKNPPAPGEKGMLQAKLSGNFAFTPTADLKAASIQGNTRLDVARAEGSLAQAATFGANFDCDVTPTEIKQVALRFQKGETRLGEVLVHGQLNQETIEGHLTVELLNLDKNVLNLAGAKSGLDFGPTTINSTNDIQLAKAGSAVNVAGQFNLNKLQVTRTNLTTPPLDFRADYNIGIDTAAGNALVRTLLLTGQQKGNQILKGGLTSPMTIAWGNTANAVGDSTLNLAVTHLDLGDWKPFLGDVAPAGDVNLTLKLVSQQAGKQLTFNLDGTIDKLTAGSGSNQITDATVTLALSGQANDLKQFKLPEYKLQVTRQNQPLVTASGSGTFDQATQNADLQLNAQLMLARLLQSLPRPDIKVSSGTADLKLHVVQSAGAGSAAIQTITGNLALADFTGNVGSNAFRSFGTVVDLDVRKTPQQVEIRKAAGKLSEGQTPGGAFELTGTYDLTNKAAQLTAKLAGFNQTGLRPFLEPMLGDKKLTSVALDANTSVQYFPEAPSSIKAELQMTNLVVKDPAGQFPATALEARLKVDASLNKQAADIRQCQITLTPTARATNQLQLTGHIDMSQTNAYQGNIKLAADSLDLTSYYDLFGGQTKPGEKQPGRPEKPATTPAPAAGPETEPEAKHLPFRNFVADATIGRLYLREVDIAGFQATAKLDGGHVALNPFKLTLNGAPVNSTIDLDLGVPGYKYSLTFNAQAVPLTPLVNSFQPERKGQLGGTFTAQTKIDGTGTTGGSLQKALAGNFDISSTNLNLSVGNIKNPVLKLLVNVISSIPELVQNPAGAVGSLVQGLTGSAASSGGLASDLQQSPINAIIARGVIGSGKVELQQATARSAAFQADASGTVTLAPVLTNSVINIPVKVALSRSVAQKINLVPANTPPNAAYAPLPEFLTLVGTLGKPDKKVNTLALAKVAAQGITGAIPGGGGKAGGIIQGILGKGGGTTTNSAGTNAPSGKVGGLLRGLGGVLNPNSGTNAPATNKSPAGGLLDQFLKPGK